MGPTHCPQVRSTVWGAEPLCLLLQLETVAGETVSLDDSKRSKPFSSRPPSLGVILTAQV